MPGFDKDEFWSKVLSFYPPGKDGSYHVRLNEEQTRELRALYIDQYIPEEKLRHYNDNDIMRKLMTGIVSIYRLDKDTASNYGEVVELVNSVDFDGRNLYLHFAKISPVKMRRFQLGKTQKQIAERMGCSVPTVKNCEEYCCDLSRQPESLVTKLAQALECDLQDIL